MGGPHLAWALAVPGTAERTAHIFTFDGYLRFWAEDRPDAIAIDTGADLIRFAELDLVTAKVAAGLADLGVGAGDRIAWYGHDAALFLVVLFAAARSGVVMVPIDPALPAAMARTIADDAGARLVFAQRDQTVQDADFAGLCSVVRVFDPDQTRAWIAGLRPGGFALPSPNAAVLQIYETACTAGRHGVVLSHCNLLGLRKAVLGHDLPHVAPDDGEAMLVAMPFWQIAGIGPVVLALAAGLAVAVRSADDPGALIDALAKRRATRLYMAPDRLAAMLSRPELARIGRKQVRMIVCGPRALPTGLRRAVRTRLGATLIRSYGVPETAGTIAMLPPGIAAGPYAVGQALPGVEIGIVDDAGNAVPTGATGTIRIRSAGTMLGYWNQPQATAGTLTHDGWIVTRDRGYLDPDGVLHLHHGDG